jgi:phosphoribosylformylglycinamidine cyclo-ligase
MTKGHFDLAGFAVGVAERDRLVTGDRLVPGDVLIGLPSTGLRCNGYSLARRVLLDRAGRSLDEPAFAGAGRSLADVLLEPSVIYAPAVAELLRSVDVKAVAHITGGGIIGNLSRVLPPSTDAVVRQDSWEAPQIFGEIQRLGEVADDEMARVFNLGIGMVVVVPPADAHRAIDLARSAGHRATRIGEVVAGSGRVVLEQGGRLAAESSGGPAR